MPIRNPIGGTGGGGGLSDLELSEYPTLNTIVSLSTEVDTVTVNAAQMNSYIYLDCNQKAEHAIISGSPQYITVRQAKELSFDLLADAAALYLRDSNISGTLTANDINSVYLYDNSIPALVLGDAIANCTAAGQGMHSVTISSVANDAQINLSGNALTQTSVDNLMASIADSGASGVNVDISGGSNASPSNSADIAAIQGNSGTVIHN